jgi:WD40 repeat protein/tetratricopeptide (TPR) repeat protein
MFAAEPPSSREQRVNEVLAAYLEAAAAGQAPERDAFLAAHPDLAAELQAFLADQARFAQAAVGLGPPALLAAQAPTLAPSPAPLDESPLRSARSFGDYELLEEIARGGMGVVYKARQVFLNRVVALKMILGGQLASPADVQRFKTEAEAVGGLDHPNIVPIYEVGEHQGQHYFSMKLIDGGSLAQRGGKSPESAVSRDEMRRAAAMIAQVARAVHYAHQRGILHRDLKPGNILLDRQGQPHITDFGLAKKVEGDSRLTMSGAIVGTPGYMAPEQAAGKKGLTTAVDVYGLGSILYELLTGRPPFTGDTPLDVLMQVLDREPVRPRVRQPLLDGDLEVICLKCLEKEPARRYASAEALADDLERFLDGKPIAARPSSAWERGRKWVRRRPAAAALVLVSLAAALIILAEGLAFLVQLRQAQHEVENQKVEARQKNTEAEQRLEQAHVEEQRASYLWNVGQARLAWLANDVAGARLRLDACPPELRQWEWRFLQHSCRNELLAFPGHMGGGTTVAFHPTTAAVATAGLDGWVKLSASDTGITRGALPTQPLLVRGLAFSADGRHLAVGGIVRQGQRIDVLRGQLAGNQGEVKLLDGLTLKEVRPLEKPPAGILCVGFSPTGKFLAAGGTGVTVWDVATGKVVHRLPAAGTVLSLAFHGDKELFTAGDQLQVWDLPAERDAGSLVDYRPPGASRVALSPDSRFLAVACGVDPTVHLTNLKGQTLFDCPGHTHPVTSLAFSPDGRRLLSASGDQTVRLWDVTRGQPLAVFRGHDEGVAAAAFGADGRQVASVGGPTFGDLGNARGEVKLWDATSANGEATVLQGHTSTPIRLALSRDGRYLASGSEDYYLGFWDTATGQPLFWQPHKGAVLSVVFSPDSRWVASAAVDAAGKPPGEASPDASRYQKGNVTLWEVPGGKELRRLQGPCPLVLDLAVSPDGQLLAAACADRKVRVWDTTTGAVRWVLEGHRNRVYRVAFSPDGRQLASGSAVLPVDGVMDFAQDAEVKVWDLAQGRERFTLEPDAVQVGCVAYSPDGRYLFSSSTRRPQGGPGVPALNALPAEAARAVLPPGLTLWDAATGQEVRRFTEIRAADHAVFSPDGRWLASGDAIGTVALWDVASGRQQFSARGHSSMVARLAFSPDGRRLASASYDPFRGPKGEVKLWDVPSGTEVLTLDGLQDVQFSADGRFLAALGPNYTLKVWSAAEVTGEEQAQQRQRWAASALAWHRQQVPDETAQQWFAARFHLTHLLQAEPDNLANRLRRAAAAKMLQDWDLALADDDTVVRLRPADAGSWDARGRVQLERQQWQNAINDFTEALKRKPDDPALYAWRAYTHLMLRQHEAALQDCNAGLKNDCKNLSASTLGLLGSPSGQGPLVAAAALYPGRTTNRFLWRYRAEAHAALRHWPEAIQDCNHALTLSPEDVELRYWQAHVCLGGGDGAGYRRACSTLLERFGRTDDADTAYQVARPCVLQAGTADPVRVLALALKAAPETSTGYCVRSYLVGAALLRAGLVDAAVQRLRAAEPVDQDETQAWDRLFLALALHHLGQKKEARALLDQVEAWLKQDRAEQLSADWQVELTVLRDEVRATLPKAE